MTWGRNERSRGTVGALRRTLPGQTDIVTVYQVALKFASEGENTLKSKKKTKADIAHVMGVKDWFHHQDRLQLYPLTIVTLIEQSGLPDPFVDCSGLLVNLKFHKFAFSCVGFIMVSVAITFHVRSGITGADSKVRQETNNVGSL